MSLRSTFLVLASVLFAVPASAEQACATNHMRARLEVFSEGSLSRPLYWVAENGGQSTFTVRIIGSGCDGSASTINYAVEQGSATTPADYSHINQPITFVNTVGHPDTQTRSVSITDDLLPVDAAVEVATIKLTSASGGSLIPPTTAPLIIVDDDGATSRVSLADGPYEENESSAITTPSGGVPVFRAGDASGTTTVDYTISGGTATQGSDYTGPTSGTLTFQPGDRMELVPIQIMDDAAVESPETVDVDISGTGVEGTTKVTMTITDNEETLPPASSIHHPNQGRRYLSDNFLIREIHIFTTDEGGAGTVAAELALRRNMKDRSCAWWTGKKFKKGQCDKERWLKTGKYETDFFFIRMNELAASVGQIKNYSAFSRAIDGAKNVESDFEVGRNANTFEVKKAR
ncbi:MAG: Calx-beta domain-containing protein [Actinomycetota bacterium]